MNISELTRRDIIDFLLLRKAAFHGRLDLIAFLKRIWDLASMPSTDSRFRNFEGDVWQHTVNNSDWDDADLLYHRLDLLGCDEDTFFAFVEQTVHPIVIRDDEEQHELVDTLNGYLGRDGYMLIPKSKISGRPVYSIEAINNSQDDAHVGMAYEVVLSFAGEDREYVEAVAKFLVDHGVRIFYDRYEEATLWGKDLTEHLDLVYRGSARYCVMFISKYYKEKIWTNFERQSALAKAVEERGEYILPARFDKTELPGIRPTIGYVNLEGKASTDLGRLILQKLGRDSANESK